MNQSETPQITGSTSSATAYGLGDITTAMNTVRMVNAGLHPQNTQLMAQGRLASQYMKVQEDANQHWQNSLKQAQSVKELPMTARRLVQVYIADPDENLPLDHAMIYQGEQK